MDFISKKFGELSATEVYEIIKSRAEIFLLEQAIVCQDLDDADYDSLHCFFWDGKRAQAYLRAFECASESGVVMIGRVLTLKHKSGMGSELMKKSVAEIKKHFACDKIRVHAQKQAVGFYEKMGFRIVSGEFLEEGVVHVTMEMYL